MTEKAEDAIKAARKLSELRKGVQSASPSPEIPEPATPQPRKIVQPKKD